jgi:RNA polymerase sigma-70 factor (ECF subfamily)
MVTTSLSLLKRLKSGGETQSWGRFVRLYTPLMYKWVHGQGIPRDEAVDIVQDVFATLVRKLPSFRYDRNGSFSRWLHTITVNRCRDFLRRTRRREQTNLELNPSSDDDIALFTEEEYRQALARQALQVMRDEFEDATWKACWEHIVSGRGAAEIGAELGITANAVYVAKSRVLRRLREELEGLWE